ncbi:MAG: Ig-like domain-containing protein [Anaerolineae bacterium]
MNRTFFLLVPFALTLGLIPACAPGAGGQTQTANVTTPPPAVTSTATPTPLPPRPQVAFTPVPEGSLSPVVIDRAPQRGQTLPPEGVVELVFDRAMDRAAVEAAFSLQQPLASAGATTISQVAGAFAWPDARTLRFKPEQPLQRGAVYDVILTQAARAADGAPLAEPYLFRFTATGFLEVGQVIPAGGSLDVEPEARITVMFNRPVVPLTTLAEQQNLPQPLEFEPPLAGQGEWLNTSIYLFTPAEPLAGGQTYQARVKAGLENAGGALLVEDFVWEFSVAPPQVVWVEPGDGQTLVDVDTALTVQFNQPVDPASVAQALRLERGSRRVRGDFEVRGNTVVFTPAERLDFDKTYQLTIEPGVTSAAGGKGMAGAFRSRFTTVPLPAIVDTDPRNGERDAWPFTDFTIYFNAPIDPATVMPHIKMSPAITATEVFSYYSPWDHSFTFDFGAKPSTDYEVEISPGIADPYGNAIGRGKTVRFRTARLEPDYRLRVPDFVGTYNANDPARVFVSYVNIDDLTLRLYRLDGGPDIIGQSYLYRDDFTPPADQLLREWDVRLDAPLNEKKFAQVDLVDSAEGTLAPGLYLLDTESPDIDPDRRYRYGRRHLLVVSEINLTVKSGQRDALVWATNLASGQPVKDLPLTFFDNDLNRLGAATTGPDGVARLELQGSYRRGLLVLAEEPFAAGSSDWTRGINPWDFGLDLAYELPDFNLHLYTDRPIYRPGQTIYFKGIIRAEDDVEFRLPDVGQAQVVVYDAAYEQIYQELLDVSANGTFNGELTLDQGAALGPYQFEVQFAGQYFADSVQVAAYRPPEFEVGVEPGRPEIERGQGATATVNATYFFGGPLAGAHVEWNLLAETFIFKPAQFGGYTFSDVDDPYVCLECWWWYQDSVPIPVLSGAGQTDASGQLQIELDGAELADLLPAGSQRVILEATITGPDNQVVAGREAFIVHRGDFYLGLSPREHVADAGQETSIDLVAVDWAGERLPGKDLTVSLVKREWINTFVESEGGGGYWDWQIEETPIDEVSLTTDGQGEAVATFTPPQGGVYHVIAAEATVPKEDTQSDSTDDRDTGDKPEPTEAGEGRIRSSLFLWVAGEDRVSWRRENHDRITLISDKLAYEPGETAEILIPSPFDGPHTALVTVERGRIIQHEVIAVTSNSQVYELPIDDGYAPNIYVSVVLVKGQDGDNPLADYKVGILPLDVTASAQTLQVSITPDSDQAEPGQEVTYTLEATDALGQPVAGAEFSLDLVDKAVLSLQPRPPEAIVQAFYGRRGLGIQTASGLAVSVNRFLEELEEDLGMVAQAEARGGGAVPPAPGALPVEEFAVEEAEAPVAQDAARAEPPPPPPGVDVRQEFADTAYWNPLVVTDEAGRAEVTLALPDNLTTWTMRGVGVTPGTQVGEGLVDLVSTMPLLVRPVAPRFFVVDDRAELAANVSNNTDGDLVVEVSLSGEGILLAGDAQGVQTVSIPARGEIKVTWDVFVQDVPNAQLIFAAVSADGRYQDASKPRLSTGPDGGLMVLRYTAPDIVGAAGQLVSGPDSRTEIVALPPRFDDRRGQLSLQLDPSLAAGMREGLDYLEHYPYECTEQTVSRFLPNVLTFRALQELGLEDPALAERLPGLVEEGLNRLLLQQHGDGGWGWWSDDDSNPHLTAYVVFALLKAREAGFDVPGTAVANGENFLLDNLKSTRQLQDFRDANRHAFLLYVLAEDGNAPPEALAALFKERGKLSHYGKAYLALALALSGPDGAQGNIDTLLSDLNNDAILSATGAHWEEEQYDWWAMNTDTRSTAIILDALARLDPGNELIPNVVRWLMVARRGGIWETTQETAWALIALTDWMVVSGELEADYEYAVLLNGEELTAGRATAENVQDSVKLHLAVADLIADAGNTLTVSRQAGDGRLYYSAHLEVYLPVEEIEPAERGIVVSRRYTLADCDLPLAQCPEVREARLGDVIRVDLTLVAPNDLYYVVVEDPLPAGAEAIDTGLATTSLLALDPALHRSAQTSFGGPFYETYFWWWRWYSRSELRDEKVVLFADFLPKGTYEYSYTMRATLPGDYHVIPTVAQEFYLPEVFGRSDGRLLSIGSAQ